jgi:hypothetical protein
MKRLPIFAFVLLCFCAGAMAQSIDDVKNLLILQQYPKAKEQLDKGMNNPKFNSKPEALILKASLYAILSADPKNADQAATLIKDAEEAYKKYLQMDPSKKLVNDPLYANTPITFYSNYYNEGIKNYNGKKWEEAGNSFDHSIEWSDFLIANKVATLSFDTSSNLLAGASYQNAKKDNLAAKYFQRIADKEIAGDDNLFLYQFLVQYYFQKNDIDNFNKMRLVGAKLYPKDEYFKYEELDFVMAGDMTPDKLKRIEEYLQKDPNNFKAQAGYGEIVFDMLNPKDETTPLPANADELEKKMDAAFRKATELSPASGFSMSNLANHYFNRAMRADRELSAHRKMMGEKATAARKNAPPPPKGKPAPEFKHNPEDIARRDELVGSKFAYYDKAADCYNKAIDIYSKISAPSTMEKQQYKNAVSYMIDIFKDKKENAQKATPPNTADAKKFEAQEKKYSDLYHKLSS